MTASLWFPPGICLESNLQPTAHKHIPLQTGCRGPHPSEEPPSLTHPPERHSRSSPSGDGFGSDCHITRCYIPPWGLRLRDNVFQEVGAVGSKQVFGAATWRLHVRTLRVSRQTLLPGVALAYGSPPPSSLAKAQTLQCYRIPGSLQSPGVQVSLVVSGLKSGPCSTKQGSWGTCPQAGLELKQRLTTRKERPEVEGGRVDRVIPRDQLRSAQIK